MNNPETWPYGLEDVVFYNEDMPTTGPLRVEEDFENPFKHRGILTVRTEAHEKYTRCDAFIRVGHPDLEAAKQLLLDICNARFL